MSSNYFSHHYISNSDLKRVRKMVDPKFDDPADLEEIFSFGTLVHALIFEPHKADKDHKDYGLAVDMSKTFFNDPMCREFIHLKDFEREKEFYKEGVFGVNARCKADGVSESISTILEFKGLSVSNEKAFEDAIERFDYDQSHTWYIDTAVKKQRFLVGVSKKAPKKLFKRIAGRDHVYYHRGLVKVKRDIQLLKDLVGDGVWVN